MDIRQLVEGATAGDQRAWKQLSARLWPRLRAWFAARVSCCDSDLLVQDTLIVMWKKLPEFEMRSEAAFMSWTFKVANFAALATLRQLKREDALTERLGLLVRTPSPRLSSLADRAERIELVLREVDNMPRSERRAVQNMLDGGSARDLAALANIEYSSARSLESRACARLRKRFREATPPP